jgi:beta-glucosidase
MSFKLAAILPAFLLLAGCAAAPSPEPPPPPPEVPGGPGVANPALWPQLAIPETSQPGDEARIADLLSRMTLEEKIGQLIQADLDHVTPEDMRRYNLGAVLNGGDSGPDGDDLAPPEEWLALADAFWEASTDRSDGGVGIPVIWGTDAMHGASNTIGAVIFPHNIGLGAARDAALVQKIGEITAREVRITGQEWTFAPTLAVPQDYRWGRTYEGYSSDPAVVAELGAALVRGLQGPPSTCRLLGGPYVLATAKHFLADGGTENGDDQGNAEIPEQVLRDVHGTPYFAALEAGAGSVMVSYSSWQGRKMSGNRSLLTGVLKERLGFDGLVVSDWNAHAQLPGCTIGSCPRVLHAGIDMYMAPNTWRAIYADLLQRARDGSIPIAEIDSAVAQILRTKLRVGLFEAPKPSEREWAGRFDLLSAGEHKSTARQAVRQSLVLLKNMGVLPIHPNSRLLVAGDAADDVARQSGGWTLAWQGGTAAEHFPYAESIWYGLNQAMRVGGGHAEFSPDGSWSERPDAAVVVFGEEPYAEGAGDIERLELPEELSGPVETIERLKAQGIPVVAVLLTGRPLAMERALAAADAFVVAWLPGSEGGGVADLLIADGVGRPRWDFTGRLPTPWPKTPDMADGMLYPFGYGLTYTPRP